MIELRKEDIYERVIGSLQEHKPNLIGSDDLDVLADCLSSYVHSVITHGYRSAKQFLEKPDIKSMLQGFGINPDKIAVLSKASGMGASDKIGADIRGLAQKMLNTLSEDFDNKLGWPYMTIEGQQAMSSAKIIATCAYSLRKTIYYLSGSNKHQDTAKIEGAIKILFSPNVMCSLNGVLGWNERPIKAGDTVENNAQPSLIVTSYVANIIIRTKPNSENDIEAVMDTIVNIINTRNGKSGFHFNGDINVSGICYALRAISTYIKFYSNRPRSYRGFKKLIELRDCIKKYLSKVQRVNGSWVDYNSDLSTQSVTALAIQALRSAGYSRNMPAVKKGCDWLLNRLAYIEPNWCWPEKNKVGIIQESVHDSALCLSALLRGTTIDKFSKAEAVLLWLVKEMDIGSLKGSIHPAAVLCAFVDYLRAIAYRDPDFFNN
jgi:hypothetical protein